MLDPKSQAEASRAQHRKKLGQQIATIMPARMMGEDKYSTRVSSDIVLPRLCDLAMRNKQLAPFSRTCDW